MSNGAWGVHIDTRLFADPRNFDSHEIRIYPANGVTGSFETTTEQFCSIARTGGSFATFQEAIEALARKVNAPFSVWAATAWIDPLLEVRPVDEEPPRDRCVRLATSTGRELRWLVDPADLHEPYGGSTTEPALLRGSQGEAKGLVTHTLVEQAIDEADTRGEAAGILIDDESAHPYRLVWGQELVDAPREKIAFATQPTGMRDVRIFRSKA
jgi:hypothetical protein